MSDGSPYRDNVNKNDTVNSNKVYDWILSFKFAVQNVSTWK